MLLLSVGFISYLLVHSFLILRTLTVLTWVFFFVFLPVMRLPWFLGMLNWRNISILAVVIPTKFIIAIRVKKVSIRVYKRTILVNVESVFIIDATRWESFFLLWATFLVILLWFTLSVIWLWSHWATRWRTCSSWVSVLHVLFATYLWFAVSLLLYWFWILFLSYIAIVVWMLLLIWATSSSSPITS